MTSGVIFYYTVFLEFYICAVRTIFYVIFLLSFVIIV